MIKLTIELVPKTSWYSNVRSNVPKAEWDRIRHKVYEAAGHVCEICGGVGKKHAVECHEVWEYDDKEQIQKLVRMVALCPACHCVKHIGRAQAVGVYNEALAQLMKVNEWDYHTAQTYIREAFDQWSGRSKKNWKLDLSGLNAYSMTKTGQEDETDKNKSAG